MMGGVRTIGQQEHSAIYPARAAASARSYIEVIVQSYEEGVAHTKHNAE